MKGRKVTDEFREACRQRYSGKGNPMYGKHHSAESKAKLSKTRKLNGTSAGEKNPMYGLKCMSEEQKAEWKKKISKANTGKKHTAEFKRHLSERAKALHIRRMHDPQTGKIANVP